MPNEPAKGTGENQNKSSVSEETRTSIDTLLELLRAKGKSELNSVAIALNIDPRIVENWAKVLESGNLVHITYEVGRMYLEPANIGPEQTANLKTKTDITKFILEEDLAIEKISLDKFSKNIEDLTVSIGNIDKEYQHKLPDIQKILAEVDRAYAPIELKKRSMEKIKEESDKDFEEINKKADALYVKLNTFSPKSTESKANEKLTQLNKVLESINDAQETMNELEANQIKFFKSMEADTESRIKELRKQMSSSKYNVEQALRSNSKQLNDLMKVTKEQVRAAQQISKEVEGFRKEFESSKHDLEVLKKDFTDRYERLRQSIEKDTKLVEIQYKHVTDVVNSVKQNFGAAAKFDEDIKRWKKGVGDMSREVTATKADILKLSNQLNALDTKNMSVEAKAKALETLEKEGKRAKERTGRVRASIKETSEDIQGKAEGKK
ncbi:MAG: hypothetical protein ACREBH_00650 [Candidatus Micrarchaeaceae archaeon]